MIFYYHVFKVSSGKEYKFVEKIYSDEEVAKENLILMGGVMRILKEVTDDDTI